MKVERLDRIYIFVKDLKKAREFFSDLLETEFSEPEESPEIDMRFCMSPLGIALTEPLTPDGFLAKTIQQRGEGVGVVAFKVKNIEEAAAECQSKGMRLTTKFTLGGVKGAAFHPRDAFGVLIDLNEYKDKHPIVDALRKK